MEAPDRDDAVRLSVVEMVDGVRVGTWVVLEVEVVEVEGVRRAVLVDTK